MSLTELSMNASEKSTAVKGRIHSLENFGVFDGPGIRFVVFMQGCSLRCIYCHNPDSWNGTGGLEMTADELISKIEEYESFIKDGGVTFSGGEPLLQTKFLAIMLEELKKRKIHTAIDTAGSVPIEKSRGVIDAADLILLDIKAISGEMYRKISGADIKNTIDTLEYCESINKKVWIRHVLIEGYTLDFGLLENMADFIKKYKCVERTELLPFHKMGEYKWKELKKKYQLYSVPPPNDESVESAKQIFRNKGLFCP